MKTYKTLFFWLGGVLVETVPQLTIAQVMPGQKGHDAIERWQGIRKFAEELSLGLMTPSDYLKKIIFLSGSNHSASDLESRILESAVLRQPVVDLITQIPGEYDRWIVVDYPKVWYEALLTGWSSQFQRLADRVILTSELGLKQMVPDIFYVLPVQAGKTRDECISVDAAASRATLAMKHGFAAIDYVYPERLKLELALQGIWKTEADVMHPTSSDRVKM